MKDLRASLSDVMCVTWCQEGLWMMMNVKGLVFEDIPGVGQLDIVQN